MWNKKLDQLPDIAYLHGLTPQFDQFKSIFKA